MAKTAQAQLIALFNADNASLAHALVEADVTFGGVATYAPADNADKRNSKLTLTAKDDSVNFSGTKELHYTRLALALGSIEITPDSDADWESSSKALETLNAELKKLHPDDEFTAQEATADVVTYADGEDANGHATRTYALDSSHIKWLATETLLVVTRLPKPVEKTDLSTTNGELNGFSE